MVNVLFVCLGNICRSPTAEGVFRQTVTQAGLADKIHIDSAGTSGWHIGEPPDTRAQQAAKRRGIDLSTLQGRKVESNDFKAFDYILAMDSRNQADLLAQAPAGGSERVHMLLSFAPERPEREVPDPYYGGDDGFEAVLDMIEAASQGLLEDIRVKHLK